MNLDWLMKDKAIKRAESEVRSATRRADFWKNAALKKEKARTKEKKASVCEVCGAKLGKIIQNRNFHVAFDAKLSIYERKNGKRVPARDRKGKFK